MIVKRLDIYADDDLFHGRIERLRDILVHDLPVFRPRGIHASIEGVQSGQTSDVAWSDLHRAAGPENDRFGCSRSARHHLDLQPTGMPANRWKKPGRIVRVRVYQI